MRLKPFIFTFLVVCCVLVYSYPVVAQEGRAQPEIEVTAGLRSDPDPVLSESEARNNAKPSVVIGTTKETQRDSVQVKALKPLKALEKVEKEEDPLSFNFLYYIIEKFKLSDIIE